jgi:hypothetical protein
MALLEERDVSRVSFFFDEQKAGTLNLEIYPKEGFNNMCRDWHLFYDKIFMDHDELHVTVTGGHDNQNDMNN